MSTPLADQPAFPHIAEVHERLADGSFIMRELTSGGLTTRQYLAAMAMQGLLSSNSVSVPKEFGRSTESAVRAKLAVMEADALIAALEERR